MNKKEVRSPREDDDEIQRVENAKKCLSLL